MTQIQVGLGIGLYFIMSRDSSVGIATGCTAGVRFLTVARDFSLLHRVKTGSEPTQPPIQWVPGALSVGRKRPGSEAVH
jgi:hypothetical protein